jgi:hypothetical protein
MIVPIKEFNQAISLTLELDLEHQQQVAFQTFTYLRTSTCLTPNKRHKLRQHLW